MKKRNLHLQGDARCNDEIDSRPLPFLFIHFTEAMFPAWGGVFQLLQRVKGIIKIKFPSLGWSPIHALVVYIHCTEHNYLNL